MQIYFDDIDVINVYTTPKNVSSTREIIAKEFLQFFA